MASAAYYSDGGEKRMITKKPGISLCMIVKDEEEFLGDCLLSVRDIVDEIIIVDTGSTDETLAIAKEFGAKVFTYRWNDSFCDARNYSLEKSSYEWALILDADERLMDKDSKKLLDFVKTTALDGAHFVVYNYIGEANSGQYTLHNALRLVRNNGMYRFKGDIHEQIMRTDNKTEPINKLFAVTDIGVHHLGYLDDVAKKKDKRNRNIPILEKELEKDPQNPFTLFNLGNEYMALKDYRKAISIFGSAKMKYNPHEAYAPHLLFRMAMCYYTLRMFDNAAAVLGEGLSVYSGCTDMMYLKGLVFMEDRRYTMALECFQKAMEMGEPHPTIKFSDDCATIKPLLSSALIYEKLKDFDKAQMFYAKALEANPNLYGILYAIAKIRKRSGKTAEDIEQTMGAFFAEPKHIPNRIMLADILLTQKLCGVCEKHLSAIEETEGYAYEKNLLRGKYHFHLKEYENAIEFFLENVRLEGKSNILIGAFEENAIFLFVSSLITHTDDIHKLYEIVGMVKKDLNPYKAKLIKQIIIVLGEEDRNILAEEKPNEVMDFFSEILKIILDCGEFELFERLLYVYNMVDSPRVLLSLAEVYMEKSFYSLAAATVIRSVKELNTIDAASAALLSDALFECKGL